MREQPSLEDLARAAVKAWDRWCAVDGLHNPEFFSLTQTVNQLRSALDAPRAGVMQAPGERVQVELRFACALLSGHEWPICDNEWRAVIGRARKMARLLLDGPDAR